MPCQNYLVLIHLSNKTAIFNIIFDADVCTKMMLGFCRSFQY